MSVPRKEGTSEMGHLTLHSQQEGRRGREGLLSVLAP